LGQDKPVYFYKLIGAGGIEEKIVALQEKKEALAEGIHCADGTAAVKLSTADIDALFTPMPAIG
jgi:SNF2 family DNA or RNA helicase